MCTYIFLRKCDCKTIFVLNDILFYFLVCIVSEKIALDSFEMSLT